jgi:hypothetical protein
MTVTYILDVVGYGMLFLGWCAVRPPLAPCFTISWSVGIGLPRRV